MQLKSAIAASALAVAALAAGTGIAHADYIGNYATLEACQADGNSPKTGGTQWECRYAQDGVSFDLYTY
ncbi:hypothetical protein [Nocardia arthritidis]|uniref:DUF333 domain-containing protein n=1 Tax=Nocardia arthritidis TaxID=228602 RepID=A0A6G9Y7S5_9NOCA|nr:hypothetical protein [Nocardia arthritidis]QIS09228.1 hypothetical protein F5544_06585 [Nocardia arthritidis]